ncbi:hypothetical protein NEMBOFW57_009674 [Staphylotrichum longicolle]|uniref:Uncharacterized protein n=1 Tax=Staphylotrichum longicolle TaxID=669026 RepID=A0AAD4EPT5_9PEZI|nr:hypothetical protein NEMBOFW57_009674 [Staphylotrichum longicolle]
MAPQLEIYVDGKGSSFRTAERGYVRLSISATSIDQAQAAHAAQSAIEKITTAIRALAIKTEDGRAHPDAAVTAFTVSPRSTESRFQRDKDNRQLPKQPKEHVVRASAEIIFRDMAKLAEVTHELATMPHVSVLGTEWRLTDATYAELEREARVKAIRNAVHKAQDYASVVGREVVAVEIKDQPSPSGHDMYHLQQALHQQTLQQTLAQQHGSGLSAAVVTEGLTLEPKTITTSAHVQAKFVSKEEDGDSEDGGRARKRR